MKKTINVKGMTCPHCVNSVTKALSALGGVSNVTVSLEKKQVTLEVTEMVTDNIIREIISDQGYEVVGIQ